MGLQQGLMDEAVLQQGITPSQGIIAVVHGNGATRTRSKAQAHNLSTVNHSVAWTGSRPLVVLFEK
ncbi:hypothetical protein E2562_037764 [Oryza meyeriana var. granulata]|uniref:Uncharacterized protein n=1 Tax=Oryza meyeriana var. granulata TaxID=110450 RepID=A0A6G1FGQ3_9ORYZ|nr:hypothetical protein E2562_037764 [Oryza meyeriana var. granulata]